MQARRQSSVIGVAEPNIWRGTNSFFPRFWEWKPQKQGLYPKPTPHGYELFASFWCTILARGGTFIAGGAQWNLMARISVLARKFRGKDQNKNRKRSSDRNLRLRLGIHSCFSSWDEINHAWRVGTSSILGMHSSKMHSSDTKSVTFFWGTILAWGAHFSLGEGTSCDLGEHGPKCASVAPGLGESVIIIINKTKIIANLLSLCRWHSQCHETVATFRWQH